MTFTGWPVAAFVCAVPPVVDVVDCVEALLHAAIVAEMSNVPTIALASFLFIFPPI
jgi:hypothetical protein